MIKCTDFTALFQSKECQVASWKLDHKAYSRQMKLVKERETASARDMQDQVANWRMKHTQLLNILTARSYRLASGESHLRSFLFVQVLYNPNAPNAIQRIQIIETKLRPSSDLATLSETTPLETAKLFAGYWEQGHKKAINDYGYFFGAFCTIIKATHIATSETIMQGIIPLLPHRFLDAVERTWPHPRPPKPAIDTLVRAINLGSMKAGMRELRALMKEQDRSREAAEETNDVAEVTEADLLRWEALNMDD